MTNWEFIFLLQVCSKGKVETNFPLADEKVHGLDNG